MVRIRDRKHLDWLKTLPCIKCNALPCDPAHIPKEMQGTLADKVDDNQAVPLCRPDHDRQHRIGHLRFWLGEREKVLTLASALHVISGDNERAIQLIHRFQK